MQLTITGYSTALFATWYFIEELGILFDAGDGVMPNLMQKSRKIQHVLLSHPDRDHLTGLLQLNQLNARPGYPVMYYPRDSQSFPALEQFSKQFDAHVSQTVWQPVVPGDIIQVKDDIRVEVFRNEHVPALPGVVKSLSYQVFQVKQKVKPKIAALPPQEIKRIIMEQGKASTTMEVSTKLIGYSGDTPVESFEHWDGTQILIHEATFIESAGDMNVNTHKNKHSTLEQVLRAIKEIKIEQLILGHFSSRYSAEQIDRSIIQLCDRYKIDIPVYRLLPGETVKDILSTTPINQ
ncbi:ribonuclease Z [Chitinophaga skermanii]|uniref:Ribonuclease Z n=1 Tax=Chitinophaga skermanii TaxID=331697 RepID=A0A327R9V3_9BACT|nr:MBL fold metallo-hydrolase [Chitinophaga skermanii]RAJ10697.1 ribonuclease Z [Chitinophaga skermanii]